MNNQTQHCATTFESVLAALQTTDRILSEKFAETAQLQRENEQIFRESRAETDRFLKERFAETAQLQKENEQIFRESRAETERFLKERFAETAQLQKENEQILRESRAETDRFISEKFAETAQLQRENEQIFRESRAETERFLKEKFAETTQLHKENERFLKEQFAESDRQRKENWENYEKRMKNMEAQMGSWRNNHGSFAEDYFFNSFENGQQNFFGEQFDIIRRGLKSKGLKIEDEYDIVLYNHTSVAIIEVKFKARAKDLQQTLKKATTFRFFYPEYKDYKIYLGLASLCYNPLLEQKYTEQGIAIIKQVGDAVIINDAHLKVF